MKCRYCNKELPKIINGRRDICDCVWANEEWALELHIASLRKQLQEKQKDLSKLKDSQKEQKEKRKDAVILTPNKKIEFEDNNICECGQFEWEHPVLPDKNYKPIKGCKKFTPKKKGLKVIDGTPTAISNYLNEREKKGCENIVMQHTEYCNKTKLCPACSLRPTRSGDEK